MRKTFLLAFILLAAFLKPAYADLNLGLSFGDDGLKGFYLAAGDYFKVPPAEVVKINKRKIPDEEVPVVLLIATKARISTDAIIDLRLGGNSWWEITVRYGISPDVYYVPVREVKGPPYGKAYGHYKKKGAKIKLADDDIINLVNLKFISSHWNLSPETVIEMRSKGTGFVRINDEVRKNKEHKEKTHKENPHEPRNTHDNHKGGKKK